jgi:hypothetical protein
VWKFAFLKGNQKQRVVILSLSSLTFGSMNSVNAGSHTRGKIKVIKAEKFVGMDAVCVISKLVEGAVAKKMKVVGKNNSQVISVESKSGDGCCTKEGAQVVLMVEGVHKDDFPAGAEIIFEKGAEEAAKAKGRVIIA